MKGLQWNPSCEATPFAPEKWPFKRGGLLSGVEINTFMFTFTLSSNLSRGGGLSSGWPLTRGSTVLCAESLHLRKKIQVTDCWYKQTHVCIAISRPFVSLCLFRGGLKSIFFSFFRNKKASFKGIYTLNGFHM